ncbi:2-dehydro-3-deoxyphosphooctonate aldolase [Flavobacteriales bacterium 33_180_T64]|nr:2-dehydro-3-deoxyphosphooctonate aldolase [Flavobacteriales bacterium 33_180_T64]
MKPAEAYLLNQPEPYRSILLHLQILIEHTFPKAELKYKWRIPCYYIGTRPICYLNQSKNYVDVGFWHSAHLTKYAEYLVSENRKVVKSLRYKALDDIDDDLFICILKAIERHKNTSFLK